MNFLELENVVRLCTRDFEQFKNIMEAVKGYLLAISPSKSDRPDDYILYHECPKCNWRCNCSSQPCLCCNERPAPEGAEAILKELFEKDFPQKSGYIRSLFKEMYVESVVMPAMLTFAAQEVAKAVEAKDAEIHELNDSIAELLRQLSETKKRIEENNQANAVEGNVIGKLYSEVIDATRKIQSLESELTEANKVIEAKDAEIAEAKKRIKQLEKSIKELENQM